MYFGPDGEVVRISGLVGEFGEVESSGGGGGVATDGAVFLNEGARTGEGWGSSPAGRGKDAGREDQLPDLAPA
jgi:hypothetical protein